MYKRSIYFLNPFRHCLGEIYLPPDSTSLDQHPELLSQASGKDLNQGPLQVNHDKPLLMLPGKANGRNNSQKHSNLIIRLNNVGYVFEWPDIKQDLEALQTVTIEEGGQHFAIRTACRGNCGKIFQAVGVALPPTIREIP